MTVQAYADELTHDAGAPPRAARCSGGTARSSASSRSTGWRGSRSTQRTSIRVQDVAMPMSMVGTATPDEQLLADGRPLRARRARAAAGVRGRPPRRIVTAAGPRDAHRSRRVARRRRSSERAAAVGSVGTAAQRPLGLALGVACGEGLALVVVALAPRQPELDLRPPLLEVDAERDERQALLLGLARDLVDLVVVEQELAAPDRIQLAAGERRTGGCASRSARPRRRRRGRRRPAGSRGARGATSPRRRAGRSRTPRCRG